MRSRPFSSLFIFSNTNPPSSTQIIHNILNRFPELKDFGSLLIIWRVERGELLFIENLAFVIPFPVHYFYKVSENTMIIYRNRNGSILYLFLTTTLKGMDV